MDEHKVPARQMLQVIQLLHKNQTLHRQDLSKHAEVMSRHEDHMTAHERQISDWDQTSEHLKSLTQGEQGQPGENGRPGKDGETPDIEEFVNAVLPRIRIPKDGNPGKKGEDAKFDEGKLLASLIKKIQDEQLLDLSHIKGAQSFIKNGVKYKIEELMHGGGTSATAAAWMPPERPVGAIDGSNTQYTISYIPVSYSGDLGVDGQEYWEGRNWTISGNVITFITPLDSSQGSEFYFHGQYLSAAPASSTGIETPVGTVNGVNTLFAASNTPSYIIVDGFPRFSGFGYTYSAGVITVDPLAPPTSFIRSIYNTSTSITEIPVGALGQNTFTVSTTPKYIVIDGRAYVSGFGYTYSSGTITVDALVIPQFYIRSVFDVGSGGVETPVGALFQNTFTVSNTPKYEIVDSSIWFAGFGYSYSAPTVSVDPLVTPQEFIRNIY